MITCEEFAHRVQEARTLRGMNMAELAECCRISKDSVRCYENADRLPTMEIVDKLSTALNVDLDYLFARQDVLVRAESIETERHATLKETGYDEVWAPFGDCSECGCSNIIGSKFCNDCGAKIDGGGA